MTDALTALVVVDLQQGTLPNARAYSSADWLRHAASLITAFRSCDLPVVIATSIGTPPGRTTHAAGGRDWPAEASVLLPEVGTGDGDILVVRRGLSVFAGTDLEDRLRRRGVTDVVIVGIATSYGVESTARAAYDLGFSVTVVADAVADLQQASHEHALATILPVIGTVATTSEILAVAI